MYERQHVENARTGNLTGHHPFALTRVLLTGIFRQIRRDKRAAIPCQIALLGPLFQLEVHEMKIESAAHVPREPSLIK